MKKLIMVPGNVSSPFFLNELEIALKYYDKVSIIDFGGKKRNWEENYRAIRN